MLRTGIIGFPQVGKTSLLRILSGSHAGAPHDVAPHLGVACVPDPRLDELARIHRAKKVTRAQLEYLDGPALVNEPEKDAVALAHYRQVDALAHVVRAFRDPAVPHLPGEVNPARDSVSLETELLLIDLDAATTRLEKLERELKKTHTPELEHERSALSRCREQLAAETPLRALTWSEEELRVLRGFMFLTAKPVLHILNAGDEEARELDRAVDRYALAQLVGQASVRVTAMCGKIEAELAELEEAEAAEFLASYGLKESARERVLHETLAVLNLITFFTVSERECRAWLAPRGTTALAAAGLVHSDFAERFIKAEVIPWQELVAAGGLAEARTQGKIRLEGKEAEVADGDVLYIRHGAHRGRAEK
ncbi:MAG: redox-regulated ATPase YchF [Acidobacteria bacterium]|nr:redox-regulated ATPase YchF [Acidobacteriota bacterium]